MRILRVISSIDSKGGGPINGLVNSTSLLIEKGHSVDVACLDDPEQDYVESFPFNVYAFAPCLGSYSYSKQFSSWMRKNIENYDVVIIHGLWQFHSYSAAKTCQLLSIPYLIFSHGMLDPWFNQTNKLKAAKKHLYWLLFERHSVNGAANLLFTSEEERHLARNVFWPYTPAEKVVPYGSGSSKTSEKTLREVFLNKFPTLEGRKFGLFLSRIHEKKGVDLLISGMKKVVLNNPDFIIAIAGPDHGGLKKILVQQIKHLGLENNVTWLGMLEGDVKWGAYYASDFFILPSHQENFGIVVAEALSTATPVLISNKVNIWREIAESGAGVVEGDTVEGVELLLSKWFGFSREAREKMSVNARECYQKNFSMESAAAGLEAALISKLSLDESIIGNQ